MGKMAMDKLKNRILLPLDGSEASLTAFTPAKSLADIMDMTLYILHISDEELKKDQLVKTLKLTDADLSKIMISHKKGNVEEIILEEAKASGLVIMCSHGESLDIEKIAGKTALRVMEESDVPIIIVRPNITIKVEDNEWLPKKVLIPLNGTPGAAQALIPACRVLYKLNSHLDLLHITSEQNKPPEEHGSFTAPYYQDYQQHEWPSWSKEFVQRFVGIMRKNGMELSLKLTLSKGAASEEIIKFAKENDTDFIALAWHGELGPLKAKTIQKVLNETPCPVLLIKIQHL